MMTSHGIIDYLTHLNESFKATDRLVQQLTVVFDQRNFEAYNALIHQKHSDVSHYLKKSLRTLRKYSDAITNSFIYRYSNGHLEGINNKIKLIKHVSFGYQNFTNFRNCILLCITN
ncbi:transposase [Brochothrix campestris]|uniref:transposase n=1 Tax=Brochothrix campestris TaxID=2757 RepID=UPI0038D1078F